MRVKKIDLFYVALFVIAEATMVITIVSVANEGPERPYYDIDTVSVGRSIRYPVYTREITRYFKPGDTLSSKENGAYILWSEEMGEELIVGIVSDSGTVITK